MAKKRRSYKISSGDYNVAGGGGAATTTSAGGDFLKIAKGHPNITNADHDGFVANNSTINVLVDVGASIPTKDQYLYIDNAFQTETGQFTIEYVAPTTGLPSGISWSENSDSTGTDMGEARIYGSPNSGTEGTYTFKIKGEYPRGRADEQMEITYVLTIAPAGTTPVFADDLPDQIIRNTAGEQTIIAAPTTTYATPVFTMSNVTGFHSSVTPVLDQTTGRIYANNVGDITQAASPHTITLSIDLGVYGIVTKAYARDIAYGDPYGARYFGPANANQNITSHQDLSASQAATDAVMNPLKRSGALRRVENNQHDTSPYLHNDGYGCQPGGSNGPSYTNQSYYNDMSGYHKFGIMSYNTNGSNFWSSGSNYREVKCRFTIPNGVETICVAMAGGGAGGAYNWAADGGGSGGFCWMNGISVTPGDVWLVYVGLGRQGEGNTSSYGAGSSILVAPNGNTVMFAEGGGYTAYQNANPNGQRTWYDHTPNTLNYWEKGNGYGGNDSRDSGGWAVNTGYGSSVNGFHYGGGAGYYASGNREGAGCPGYRGNQSSHGSSHQGSYGGGGYGYNYSSTYGQGAGGGTGLDGQGWRGYHGSNIVPRTDSQAGSGYGGSQGNWYHYNNGSSNFRGGGGGGSGGTRGAYGENQFTSYAESNQNLSRSGGLHGGGGGGSGTSNGGGNGASGGVRIIWGVGEDGTARSFPYTYCSEKPSMKYNGES